MNPQLTQRLRDIARDIGRLRPDWQRPDLYFEAREELRAELVKLASQIETRNG